MHTLRAAHAESLMAPDFQRINEVGSCLIEWYVTDIHIHIHNVTTVTLAQAPRANKGDSDS